jgi:hypothetical protein
MAQTISSPQPFWVRGWKRAVPRHDRPGSGRRHRAGGASRGDRTHKGVCQEPWEGQLSARASPRWFCRKHARSGRTRPGERESPEAAANRIRNRGRLSPLPWTQQATLRLDVSYLGSTSRRECLEGDCTMKSVVTLIAHSTCHRSSGALRKRCVGDHSWSI